MENRIGKFKKSKKAENIYSSRELFLAVVLPHSSEKYNQATWKGFHDHNVEMVVNDNTPLC